MRKRKEEEKKLKEKPKQTVKKEVYPDPKDKGDNLKTPFQQFLVEHTVKLPDSKTNQFKLLKNMQAKNYFEVNAKELGLENIVLMNEERRRYKKLPPLTPLDYNCIDKAASKIKTVLDTLSIVRKVNGKTLVKRNMKEHLKAQTPLRTLEKATRVSTCFSPEFVINWESAIVYPDKFNRDQILIQKSLAIKEEQSHDEIKEVDSEHEETDPNHTEREQSSREMNSVSKAIEQEYEQQKEISISKHVGSVEEFSPAKLLIEQGQVQLDEYDFFCNVYFRQFKLDHIENYKDFRKLLEFTVISTNKKLYRGKDFPNDYLQQLERSKKELTEYISFCEIEIMSRSSLSNWRDSIELSWEKLCKFFKFFQIKFNPTTFIRSRRFSNIERYIFFNYISS